MNNRDTIARKLELTIEESCEVSQSRLDTIKNSSFVTEDNTKDYLIILKELEAIEIYLSNLIIYIKTFNRTNLYKY